ncbi:MAG: hypothetical protein CMD16_02060 [Flavobacteriales bacterium]|nr:hypothetical protein [Flavobacteriales bacterium]|tara:strand:+ start:92906 stop:93520 length:615 start_codon:yes stop_codon:yes gene_type:complete
MLKKFTVLLFCGFLTYNIQGQNFDGGIILGISTSQVRGDDLAGFNKAGILAGAFVNKKISQLLSLQMEMTYIQKGSNNPKMNENGIRDISLSYIEIPVLLQYHQSDILAIEAGVLVGYLIDGYYNDIITRLESEKSPFIKHDIGLALGIDYKYSEKINLNTRMSTSFLPIGTEDEFKGLVDLFNANKKGKYNSVLSFTIHYNLS